MSRITGQDADHDPAAVGSGHTRPTLFQAALQDRWAALAPAVQRLHSGQEQERFSGTAEVTRGSGLIAHLAAWFFRFPKAGRNVRLTMIKTRTERGETWERNFAGRVFRSYLTPADALYRYCERFWLFNYEQDLPVRDGALFLCVRRGWFFGIPIPRPFLPESDSREFAVDGGFHFDISVSAPLGGGLIVRYRGQLSPDA